MNTQAVQQPRNTGPSFIPGRGLLLQRKYACGGSAGASGGCEACRDKKRLQTKLAIGASNDPLEQEADRVADQVLATPAHFAVGGAAPRIQRFAGQPATEAATAPASVDHVLAGSGRPLEPALRHDMEQRFGHDFSRVRVHADAAAGQSAQDVNANAYTAGHHIAFGVGRFSPGTRAGQALLAHELTHVVQQGGASPRVSETHQDSPGAVAKSSSAPPIHGAPANSIQRQPKSEGPSVRDLPIFLEKLELDVGQNLQDYGHHLYQAAILHPDEPDILRNAVSRYALGLNVLKDSYRFAGFRPDTADKLALGTGILFKGLTFLRKGEFVFDFQVDIGHGVKFETNIDLAVKPEDPTQVRKGGVNFGLTGSF